MSHEELRDQFATAATKQIENIVLDMLNTLKPQVYELVKGAFTAGSIDGVQRRIEGERRREQENRKEDRK